MPKSNKKSKSKNKQSQKQKQTIVVNVNSNNKRKSTHYHNKNSNNPPAHIVVPSTNHHMMFMPQPQGLPPPNLLGDNNYGVGQARLLDTTLQRINESLDQSRQDALNNSRRQEALNDIRQDEERFYNRNDYPASQPKTSSRGAGQGEGYARSRARSHSVHNEDELLYAQMQDINPETLTSAQRNIFADYIDRASQNQQNNEPFATVSESVAVDPVNINYDYQSNTSTMNISDLATFSGSITPSKLLEPSFKSPLLIPFTARSNNRGGTEYFNDQGSIVPNNVVQTAIDNFYSSPSPLLLLENTPSKAISRIEDIKYASVENDDKVIIKKVEQSKEDRDNMRKAQRQKNIEQQAQEKEIADLQRIVKENEEAERVKAQTEELKKLRDQKNQKYQKATEVASSKKFENADELISAFDDMNLVANGSSSEITAEVLKKYNKLRQAFGLRHVGKVADMGKVIQFLNENIDTYNEIKKTHKPKQSNVPTSRFKANNVTNATDLLTSSSEPKLLPPVKAAAGGGAKQKK